MDTDYTEKPDGIPMNDSLRSVVSLVQLENDIQMKQNSKQTDMIQQKTDVKAEVKTDVKAEIKTDVKAEIKTDVK